MALDEVKVSPVAPGENSQHEKAHELCYVWQKTKEAGVAGEQ